MAAPIRAVFSLPDRWYLFYLKTVSALSILRVVTGALCVNVQANAKREKDHIA